MYRMHDPGDSYIPEKSEAVDHSVIWSTNPVAVFHPPPAVPSLILPPSRNSALLLICLIPSPDSGIKRKDFLIEYQFRHELI